MNTAQKSVLALMKSAITGQPQPLPKDFSMEDVLEETKAHHMIAMVYEGAALCGVGLQTPEMQALFPKYCKSAQVSARQMRDLKRVFQAFEENAIDYMPLKGSKLKALYPKPEFRMMGDADVLIRMEQYEKIIPALQDLGFTEKYETDHELVWQSSGLSLELHKCLIPSYNKDFYGHFQDGWHLAKPESGCCYTMNAEDEFVFLFTHFAKHYRDGGVGCRYVSDLWLYRRAHADMDEQYILQQMQKLQLAEFYSNVLQLLAVWFEDAPMDAKTDVISEFIFASGSWGSTDSKMLSRSVRDAKHGVVGFSGKLTYLWTLLFPDIYAAREKYPVLKKYPWMLPLVWLWRPFYKILFERSSLAEKKQQMDKITEEKMDQRREMLRYVGLEYNF